MERRIKQVLKRLPRDKKISTLAKIEHEYLEDSLHGGGLRSAIDKYLRRYIQAKMVGGSAPYVDRDELIDEASEYGSDMSFGDAEDIDPEEHLREEQRRKKPPKIANEQFDDNLSKYRRDLPPPPPTAMSVGGKHRRRRK